jgi:hypothetical protein
MEICIDFDGTCVAHEFPKVGKDIGAQPVLKRLVEKGHNLILFTMRCDHTSKPSSTDAAIIAKAGKYLTDATKWFEKNGIPLYGIQTNPAQRNWTESPKAYGQMYIDDAALGCPLVFGEHERPFVDWKAVENMLEHDGIL